jgi:hypothetical protein
MKTSFLFVLSVFAATHLQVVAAPQESSPANASVPASPVSISIFPDKEKQVVKGLGFEIQSDSIGSGNHGLPEEPIGVPHDLTPAERERLAHEMLKGFRYCRLAGGLYWRGLDAEKKFLRPRWPEQLTELRDLLDAAGVEGVSFEYWSPAPYWKGNQAYFGVRPHDRSNRLRCFSPGFADDPVYRGDTNRFLAAFADAVVTDIQTLKAAGIKTSMWGLQNEPEANNTIYSTCAYPDSRSYVMAYQAVASAIRKHDPQILLFADTEGGFPHKIAPAMNRPEIAALVDAYAVHIVGSPSETPLQVHKKITAKLPPRPWFQNEYEYLTGGATPSRCLNTVQHIMNSFQLAENPTWFWIHCLKPIQNAEASGYALGFWKSLLKPPTMANEKTFSRWTDGPEIAQLPAGFDKFDVVSPKRGNPQKPGMAYHFDVNQPVTVYLLVEKIGDAQLDSAWVKTTNSVVWTGGADVVYQRKFPAGSVSIPPHNGKQGDRFGVPHLAFVEPSAPATFKAEIGMNLPIQVRSEALLLARKIAAVKPGHWIYNPYNWNAVGSFAKRMPWDSVVVNLTEEKYNPDARILAFKKPNGKLTVVLSNRTPGEYEFRINTGLDGATFKGFRYRPDDAGKDTMGVAIGTLSGRTISPKLPRLAWEFWEQQ